MQEQASNKDSGTGAEREGETEMQGGNGERATERGRGRVCIMQQRGEKVRKS